MNEPAVLDLSTAIPPPLLSFGLRCHSCSRSCKRHTKVSCACLQRALSRWMFPPTLCSPHTEFHGQPWFPFDGIPQSEDAHALFQRLDVNSGTSPSLPLSLSCVDLVMLIVVDSSIFLELTIPVHNTRVLGTVAVTLYGGGYTDGEINVEEFGVFFRSLMELKYYHEVCGNSHPTPIPWCWRL